MLMMIPDFTDEELSSNQSSYSKDSPLLQYHHSINKNMFGMIPPLKVSNRIRVDCVRLCFLPAVAWQLWCESWCWIILVDVVLSWKKDTHHKLITTSPSLLVVERNAWYSICRAYVRFQECIIWATNYHVLAHSNLALLIQDEVFGICSDLMTSNFPVWFETATVKGWSYGRRDGPIILINDVMKFSWMIFWMCHLGKFAVTITNAVRCNFRVTFFSMSLQDEMAR